MKVGVPQELAPGERRVALVPETVSRLDESVTVVIAPSAGAAAGFADEAYSEAGAEIGDLRPLVRRFALSIHGPVKDVEEE